MAHDNLVVEKDETKRRVARMEKPDDVQERR